MDEFYPVKTSLLVSHSIHSAEYLTNVQNV